MSGRGTFASPSATYCSTTDSISYKWNWLLIRSLSFDCCCRGEIRRFAVIVMVLGICISKCARDYYESVCCSVSLLVIIVFCRPTSYQRTTPPTTIESYSALPLPHSTVHVVMARRDIPRALYIVAQKSRGRGTRSYQLEELCAMNPVGLSKVVVLLLLLQIINTD